MLAVLHLLLQLPYGCQSCFNNFIHIIVFIIAEAPAEDDILFFVRKFFISGEEGIVLFIVYRVVRLHADAPLGGIFPGDDGLWLLSEFKVLVFDDSCVRHFTFV